jgi:predicted GNAT family acetyltransferase
VDVEHLTEAEDVLASAGPLLLADEARHNLALGILSTARALPGVYPALLGWVARDEGRVVGVAIRTPPHNVVLAKPTDPGAIEALAEAIEMELPGVVGAVPEVDSFASAWAGRHDVEVRTAFDQRIYALRELAPTKPVPGALRLAGDADRSLLLEWVREFAIEALGGTHDTESVAHSVDARLEATDAGIVLWEVDGLAVSLAGFSGPTPNGIRIGPVYTPPEHRNHGYGTAVTAALSRLLLERGHRFCFLFTDLGNPTSNSIYTRIGYEPVCDSRELSFVRPH